MSDIKVTDETHVHTEADLRAQILRLHVLAWLGVWRDKMPSEAVLKLQDLLNSAVTRFSGQNDAGSGEQKK